MSQSGSGTAIDVGPKPANPVLAFVLALLAIPGSTIAWDLPAGGLWIGLPLAIAAIVLGLRSRREQSSKLGTAAIVIAGLCIAQMAVWSVASALGSEHAEKPKAVERVLAGTTDKQASSRSPS